MQRPPPISQAPRYPVITATALASIIVSLTWWSGQNISFLFDDLSIERGQLWRLITDVLPHANILHLAFNLIWLWSLGTLIESHLGSPKTLLLLLYLAIGSSAAEFAFLQGGVGLSGVVYGLAGFLWILQRHDPRFANAIDHRNASILFIWFLFCIYTSLVGIFPVANIAHGVGAALGILLAWSMQQRTIPKRAGAPAAVLLLLLLAGTLLRPYINFSPYRANDDAHRGYQALINERPNSAVYWLKRSTTRDPSVAENWFNLGLAHHHLKDLPAAAFAYHKALELNPKDPDYQKVCRQVDDYLAATAGPSHAAQ